MTPYERKFMREVVSYKEVKGLSSHTHFPRKTRTFFYLLTCGHEVMIPRRDIGNKNPYARRKVYCGYCEGGE